VMSMIMSMSDVLIRCFILKNVSSVYVQILKINK